MVQLIARIKLASGERWAEPLEEDRYRLLEGSLLGELRSTTEVVEGSAVRILPPIMPRKIIGIGANFPGDDEGLKLTVPSFFLKASSSVIAHREVVRLPPIFKSVLAEGELAVVLRAGGKNVSRGCAGSLVLGYTIINDLSGRDSPIEVVPPAAKKSADGFAPLGPYLDLDSRLRDFEIITTRNGNPVQHGNTRDLIFGIAECLSFISTIMTLEPLDLIAMGTPPPKPKLVPGDEVGVSISGIGTLVNTVSAAD